MAKDGNRFIYTIELGELDYATLMQLVMKYGSGTGEGTMSTSVTLRVALADAQIRTDKDDRT